MTQVAAQIINSLNEIFAPMDIEVLEKSKIWAIERAEEVKNFYKTEEYAAIKRNPYVLYNKLYEIAGGKTWYNIFYGRNKEMIEEFVVKNCTATVEKRNHSITAKLMKAGVTEVLSQEYVYTSDGFNGIFVVKTNTGNKVVTINTIRAGGFNIQCLHLRVLVKVK